MNIGVLLYTYNRTDDARINLEIIRNVWSKSDLLKHVTIVHSFNGAREWWPEKYLEDELLYLTNPGHFAGAELLLNKGIKTFSEKFPETDYVVILASDTWCLKPEYIEKTVHNMKTDEKYLATCAWGTAKKNNMWQIGMAIDFAIVDLTWVTTFGVFPIRYKEFAEKYRDISFYHDEIIYPERVLATRFKEAILKAIQIPSENLLRKISEAHIYHMKEREPVHDARNKWGMVVEGRKMYWPNIGLVTYHEPGSKQKVLKKFLNSIGPNADKLVRAKDLAYFNQGARKTEFIKGKAKINYGD